MKIVDWNPLKFNFDSAFGGAEFIKNRQNR